MERPQHHFKIAVGTLVAFYLFGLIGMHIPLANQLLAKFTPFESFISLTPLNLIITFGILLYFNEDWHKSLYFFLIGGFLFSFFVEVAGVQTGLIFGHYQYGETLGFKLFDTPLMIGINWVMLVYSGGIFAQRYFNSLFLKTFLAAGYLMALDIFIEPVAMRYDFWDWLNHRAPWQNYMAWFVVALIMSAAFYLFPFKKQNKIAPFVFVIQVLFFLLNNLLLAR